MSDSPQFWQPTCRPNALQVRAAMLRAVRDCFHRWNYLEVETPAISRDIVVDPWIEPLCIPDLGGTRYLQTSPEACMKRLLASGTESIYQICHVFRRDECGARHNTEFTMIEWYGLNTSLADQMQLTEELVRTAVQAGLSAVDDRVFGATWRNLTDEPFQRLTYDAAFREWAGLPVLNLSAEELERLAEQREVVLPESRSFLSRDEILNVLLATLVEPQLGRDHPQFLYHYPATQAALAKLSADDARVAERFELYVAGVELCNGYEELTDPAELRSREHDDNRLRSDRQRSTLPGAPGLIAAMNHGLPACSGVALGFDRLAMLTLGCDSIREVIPFPWDVA